MSYDYLLKNPRVLLKWTKTIKKLAVLDAVRSAFFKTNEFIDSALKKGRGNFFASKLTKKIT